MKFLKAALCISVFELVRFLASILPDGFDFNLFIRRFWDSYYYPFSFGLGWILVAAILGLALFFIWNAPSKKKNLAYLFMLIQLMLVFISGYTFSLIGVFVMLIFSITSAFIGWKVDHRAGLLMVVMIIHQMWVIMLFLGLNHAFL